MTGLDVVYTNRTTNPVTVLPLSGLDVDASHFTTSELPQAEPMRFSVSLRGGKVALPERKESASLIRGLVGKATSLVTGSEPVKSEERPLFDELAVSGTMQLHPTPTGQVRVSVSTFELQSLGGLAAGGSVEIGDGMLDAGVALDLMSDSTKVDANLTFTALSLSEPMGGPISSYLRLPAPLDTVLYVLRNDADEQHIPLSFELSDRGVSTTALTANAISAFGIVLAKAIAASPLRLTGGITRPLGGLLGLSGGHEDLAKQAQALPFASGATDLAADIEKRLGQLADLVSGDEDIVLILAHALGQGDAAHAAVLANPPRATTMALAARLRQERSELQARRAKQAAAAAGLFAGGENKTSSAAAEDLRALDTRLAAVEAALRPVLGLLRDDAENHTDRRTRAACLQIAEARLEAVRGWLAERAGPKAAARIQIRRPRSDGGQEAAGAVVVTPRRQAQG
jgi:hypothetical protein